MPFTRRLRSVSLTTAWQRLVARRSAQKLLELDDHLLRDVGLTRDAAERLARGSRF